MAPQRAGAATFALALLALVPECVVSTSAKPCLTGHQANGTKYVLMDGTQVPLGVYSMDWISGRLVSRLYKIIASEVLGYKVVEMGPAPASMAGFFAVAGCKWPMQYSRAPQCGSLASRSHVVLEAWEGQNAKQMRQTMEDNPDWAPKDLGSIGYGGTEAMFVLPAQKQAAWNDKGLALQFYASYNTSWHQPEKYFDNYKAVPTSRLRKCADTNFVDTTAMREYFLLSNDVNGTVKRNDGSYVAKCWDDHWWFSPACRKDPQKCIFTFTAGYGWGLHEFMVKAWALDMPLAITVATGWSNYLAFPKNYKALMYWWTPAVNFIDMAPEPIAFPPHDKEAWDRGDKRTMSEKIVLHKFAWHGLKKGANRAYDLLMSFTISEKEINKLLKETKVSGEEATACNWIQQNQHKWKNWISDATRCIKGAGLVDAKGNPVGKRKAAAGCASCKPGTFSVAMMDWKGITYKCALCPPGKAQPDVGQRRCRPCQEGTYTKTKGEAECKLCGIGRYQAGHGNTSCEVCPHSMPTMVLGAKKQSECVCPNGMYLPLGANGCENCPEGMTCAQGSEEANLPPSPGVQAKGCRWGCVHPVPSPRFYSTYKDPMSVYRCKDDRTCPGGAFETCGPNMEGLACGKCLDGYWRGEGQCKKCNDIEASPLLFPVLPCSLGMVVVLFMYRTSRDLLPRWGSPGCSVMTAIHTAATYLQTLAIVSTLYLMYPKSYSASLEWPSDFIQLLMFFRPDCGTFAGFKASYLGTLLIPAYVVAVFMSVYAVSFIISWRWNAVRMDRNVLLSCFGGVIFTFYIGLTSSSLSLLQCYDHPNGSRSLRMAPDVICYSAAWKELLMPAIFSILAVCVGFFGVTCYAVFLAPRCFSDEGFRARWKFLFVKFRPSVWWWSLVLLVKGLCLNMATVMFASGVNQVGWMATLLLSYLLGSYAMLPWRSYTVTLLDGLQHAMLGLLFSFLPYFSIPSEVDLNGAGGFGSFVAILPVVGSAAGAIYLFYGKMTEGRTAALRDIQQRSEAKSVSSIMGRLASHQDCARVLSQLSFRDLRSVHAASNAIASELFAERQCGEMEFGKGADNSVHPDKLATDDRVARAAATAEGRPQEPGSSSHGSAWTEDVFEISVDQPGKRPDMLV